MTAVIQRVKRAAVIADGVPAGKCKAGLLILLGVFMEDTETDAQLLAEKIAKLRIFEDENGKMNLSVRQVGGEAVVVSNFTLCADYRHGNRPDFFKAAPPAQAKPLYESFCILLREKIGQVESGVFGADMQIDLLCAGPVTIAMDSRILQTKREKREKVERNDL